MKKNIIKTFAFMFSAMFLAKILGLVRNIVFANFYGTGFEATAFFTASRIPLQLLDITLGAAISSTFIPVFNEFMQKHGKERAIAFANNFLNVIPTNVYEIVCIGGLIGIVIIRLHMTEDITGFITKLAIVAVAAFRLFPAVSRLTTNLNAIMYNRPRLDSMYDMLKTIENEGTYHYSYENDEQKPDFVFEKELKIDNITWKYPAGQSAVLKNLKMTIGKGQSIALIGPSGAGKTTLADVVLGLLKPQEGKILLDGEDVYENLPGWAKIIGYVPQAVYLTDDTIRNNVAFGIYEDQIDEDKVWKALEEAQLAEFVRGLEEGLDTMVGERGVRLSGGQRQRIAIARALYENPEILVLDEATSALDTETETAVMESIDSLHGTKTMIIVAHRLTTIRNCDAIYEIKDGVAVLRDKAEVIGEA